MSNNRADMNIGYLETVRFSKSFALNDFKSPKYQIIYKDVVIGFRLSNINLIHSRATFYFQKIEEYLVVVGNIFVASDL